MASNKKKVEKKYNFRQIIKCAECGLITEIAEPCEKCGGKIFITELELQEI